MCNPVLWVAGAVAAVGAVRKGAAERDAQKDAATSLDYQAAVERDNAQAEAQQIRQQGERDRGSTVANIAASGVKLGTGSANDAERMVLQNSETDAAMAILNGERAARGLNSQAVTRRRAGREAMTAGYISAVGSLLSRGASGMSGSSGSNSFTMYPGNYSYSGDGAGFNFSASGSAIRARR